jgi:hypothetical protein
MCLAQRTRPALPLTHARTIEERQERARRGAQLGARIVIVIRVAVMQHRLVIIIVVASSAWRRGGLHERLFQVRQP